MEKRCPTCRATVAAGTPTAPFCCERCRLLDLGSWLDGRYRVAGSAEEDARPSESDGDGD